MESSKILVSRYLIIFTYYNQLLLFCCPLNTIYYIGIRYTQFHLWYNTKQCKIKLFILNHGTLKWISISSSIKYDLEKLICKFMNLQTLIIINIIDPRNLTKCNVERYREFYAESAIIWWVWMTKITNVQKVTKNYKYI